MPVVYTCIVTGIYNCVWYLQFFLRLSPKDLFCSFETKHRVLLVYVQCYIFRAIIRVFTNFTNRISHTSKHITKVLLMQEGDVLMAYFVTLSVP
jgi:hypothetical protein